MADERAAYNGTSSEETPIEKKQNDREFLRVPGHFLMECVVGTVLYNVYTAFFDYA